MGRREEAGTRSCSVCAPVSSATSGSGGWKRSHGAGRALTGLDMLSRGWKRSHRDGCALSLRSEPSAGRHVRAMLGADDLLPGIQDVLSLPGLEPIGAPLYVCGSLLRCSHGQVPGEGRCWGMQLTADSSANCWCSRASVARISWRWVPVLWTPHISPIHCFRAGTFFFFLAAWQVGS